MRRLAIALSILLWFAILAHAEAPHFQHVIVIVQENRTPDNLFQGLCMPPYGTSASCSTQPGPNQYNIQTSNWLDKTQHGGVTQPQPVALANDYDLSHAHEAFTQMCDKGREGCKMDGAARIVCYGDCPGKPQFRYVDNSSGVLNPYLEIATQFGWANYMFQTNQGPSFPAHQFLFGGTSAPTADADALGIFASENVSGTTAGCIAARGTTVQLILPPGIEPLDLRIYPCFEHMTMGDFQQYFSWKYYAPSAGSIWTAPTAIQHICQSSGYGGECQGEQWTNNVDLHPADVLTDIANCNLRNVSWVIPTAANSDHARVNDGGGPSWVASIVNAVGASDSCDGGNGYWNDTAIFITWDDWGGWYDHAAPEILRQPEGDYQYGFRVPLLVVSAYTPAGYINPYHHHFGSILRFIERNFGIPEGALNFADARAKSDLTLFFDSTLAPRTFQPIPTRLDKDFFTNDKRPAGDPDDD